MTEHQKENKEPLNSSNRSSETAKKILETMPPWQREYANAIVDSVTSTDSNDSLSPQKMFK